MYQLNSYSKEGPTAKEIALLLNPKADSVSSFAFASHGEPKPNKYWYVDCPAHEDNQKSLLLKDGPHGIQMTCRAGCPHAHVRAYVYREIANKAVVKSSSRKVVSIERKEQIKRSVAEIKRHSSDLFYICLDWAKWKIQEITS